MVNCGKQFSRSTSKVHWLRTVKNATTYFKIKFSILVPQLGMVTGQDFTIKNGIVIADFCACNGASDFHGLVGLK